MKQGEGIELPGGYRLVLQNLTYYARLKIVDDGSVPLLYAWLVVAGIGLSIASLGRQQVIVVAVASDESGDRILGRVRVWRNSTTSCGELKNELGKALRRESTGGSS